MNHHSEQPDYLAEAFHIANGRSPLKPVRENLQALITHYRTFPVFESKPSIRCENCIDGFVPCEETRSGKTECPVCDGDPNIKYSDFLQYSITIDALRARVSALVTERNQLRSTVEQREMVDKLNARLAGRRPASVTAINLLPEAS